MKEVFRHADSALVGLYQSILENAGIATFVGNIGTQQAVVAGIATAFFPLPLFFPTLYVVNDDDYSDAMTLLRSIKEGASPGDEWTCRQCGEVNPGNFDLCWKCQAARTDDETTPAPTA